MWKNMLVSAAFGVATGLVAVYLANNTKFFGNLVKPKTTA